MEGTINGCRTVLVSGLRQGRPLDDVMKTCFQGLICTVQILSYLATKLAGLAIVCSKSLNAR